MKASNTKSKRKAKDESQAQVKVRDLVPKKDTRGGEVSIPFSKIKYDYHPQ